VPTAPNDGGSVADVSSAAVDVGSMDCWGLRITDVACSLGALGTASRLMTAVGPGSDSAFASGSGAR
jgi:hypothetical protein